MKYDILIKNGNIITPFIEFTGDIGIRDGKIKNIGKVEGSAAEVIDASGKFVTPGFIDIHVHFSLSLLNTTTADDFYTGSISAAFGGITTFIDFTDPLPDKTLPEAITLRKKIASKSVIDYGLHAVIVNWQKNRAKEIKEAVKMGVTSFKFFTTYSDSNRMTDSAGLLHAFGEISKVSAVAMVHAEDDEIVREFTRITDKKPEKYPEARPSIAEALAVEKVALISNETKASLHIAHLSSKKGVKAVEKALKEKIDISIETAPHYLTLTDKDASLYISVCPPLRKEEDSSALWEAIKNDTITIVSSDHCAFTKKQKEYGKDDFKKIPFGLPGVETLWPILYTLGYREHRIPFKKLISTITLNPAMRFGMFPQKGVIAPESDADIVIIGKDRCVSVQTRGLHSASDYTPYEGIKLCGFPETVISNGKVIIKNGIFSGKGAGRFYHRSVQHTIITKRD